MNVTNKSISKHMLLCHLIIPTFNNKKAVVPMS